MKLTTEIRAEIRRLNELTARNATPGEELTREELWEAYAIADRPPESRRQKCWVCWEKKDPVVIGTGLYRGHLRYIIATGK